MNHVFRSHLADRMLLGPTCPLAAGQHAHHECKTFKTHAAQRQGARGLTQEDYPDVANNAKVLTTNQGTPVSNNSESRTAGPRGPVLLEDYALIEKLAQFDRERIPERVLHARGAVAKGFFELTEDISDVTEADFLNGVGKQTPVAVRFSTATHEKGSPESLRDLRGFAIKFYTQQGNWDLTGNNLPVFFIRDGYTFVDLVHSMKPSPKTNIQEGWRMLDWLASKPESLNLLTYLLGDEGIPVNWRTCDGFGVNTFVMYKGDKETYVKYNWKTKTEGPQYMSDEEAQMAGKHNMRHSHATHDLYNHVGTGKTAEWDFFIQTMDKDKADAGELGLDFDPLDSTKLWPEEDFPWKQIGKLVIDTPVSNFHNESEQIAFSPGSVVPGLALSEDKILQTRAFSYPDTQRYRLGVNYQTLPINAPKAPMHANQEAGTMNPLQKNEQINYWPSIADKNQAKEANRQSVSPSKLPGGNKEKSDYGNIMIGDDYKQPGNRIRSLKPESRDNLKEHFVAWLTDPKGTEEVASIWFDHLGKADKQFGDEVKEAVLQQNGGKFGHPDAVPCSLA